MKRPLDLGRMAAVIMVDGMPSVTAGFRSAEANALKLGKVLKVSREAGKFGFRDCVTPEKAVEELRKMPAGTICVMPRSRRLTYDVLFDMPEPVDEPVFERKYESCGTVFRTVPDCAAVVLSGTAFDAGFRSGDSVSLDDESTPDTYARPVATLGAPSERPVVTVVFITKDRTRVARETVRFLVRNLRYAGRLRWCVCDDGSLPGHVGSIRDVLLFSGVSADDVFISLPEEGSSGLGASMNRGLRHAFSYGDVAFTVEDDWILEKRLDITRFVDILMSDGSAGMVRLGTYINAGPLRRYDDELSVVTGSARAPYVFVHQVALRHRRAYVALGWYPENCPGGRTELEMATRYNQKFRYGLSGECKVLIPNCIERGVSDGPGLPFIHVGQSLLGHVYSVPTRYGYLYRDERVFVTLTSYPKRITNVSASISSIMDRQSRPPDEVHLWLSSMEFPGLESDLPVELLSETDRPGVFLHWLPGNTYVHKRHELFKYVDDDVCVFSIDDDVLYSEKLIETTMEVHDRHPLSPINYEAYSEHLYRGHRTLYGNFNKHDKPSTMVRLCGQSMVPSVMYPRTSLSRQNVAIRDRTSPINDEPWINPWMVWIGASVLNQHFGWGTDIDKNINKWDGLCSKVHKEAEPGMSWNDKWLYAVLNEYPDFMKAYEERFGYGKAGAK